jgi:hypothetical protein
VENTTHLTGDNAIPVHGFIINPAHVITRKLNGTTISTTYPSPDGLEAGSISFGRQTYSVRLIAAANGAFHKNKVLVTIRRKLASHNRGNKGFLEFVCFSFVPAFVAIIDWHHAFISKWCPGGSAARSLLSLVSPTSG